MTPNHGEAHMSPEPRLTVTPQLTVGICIMLFGVLLTLDRLQIVSTTVSFRLWPVVLIGLGAWIVSRRPDPNGRVGGYGLMFLGGWLLLNSLGLVRVRIWELFWPLVITFIGWSLIMQTLGRPGLMPRLRRRWAEAIDDSAARNSNGSVSLFAAMGGSRRASSDKPFRGGEMTAIMGGCQLDLRQATLAVGEDAVINILSVMGGHEIYVPPDWTVDTHVVPLLGGVQDKRLPLARPPTASNESPGRLVLRGIVIMGGLVLRS